MGSHCAASVTLVLGGTRSGKSAVAERLAAELASSAELPAVLVHLDGSVLVDSLGTWVASAPELEIDAPALVHALQARSGSTVLVSEEVGLAVHPATAVGRAFVDAVGQLNQTMAAVAERVLLVVAGRTLEL